MTSPSTSAIPAVGSAPRGPYGFTQRRPWILHPLVLHTGIWTLVAALYSLRLAAVQVVPPAAVWSIVTIIVAAFAAGSGAITVWLNLFPIRPALPLPESVSWHRIRLLMSIAVTGLAAEVVAFRGVPLLWKLLPGTGLSYFDFGFPSLNGLLLSMVLAVGLVGFYLRLTGKEHRPLYLLLAWMPFLWGIALISRAFMVFAGLEYLLLWLIIRRPNLKRLFELMSIVLMGILLFGVIGNFRSGTRNLVRIAGFTPWSVSHIPAEALWTYAYTVTPVDNLAYTVSLRPPAMDWAMPNTAAVLFPSVIRKMIYSNGLLAESGILVNPIFTVSTAYAGPYQDLGWIGVLGFAAFWGGMATWAWKRVSAAGLLVYCVLAVAAILSMFFNLYLYLPFITQGFWIAIAFRKHGGHALARSAPFAYRAA